VAAGEGAENGCDWGMRRDVARLDSTRRGGRAAEARGMGHAMAHSVRPTDRPVATGGWGGAGAGRRGEGEARRTVGPGAAAGGDG
jgi:hypothetical protein